MSNIKFVALSNVAIKAIWVVGAYFLAIADHTTMAAWCIVGAIVTGIDYSRKKKSDE